MPWARLDDTMLNHPKLIACSPPARWLFVSTILFCRQNHAAGEMTRGQMASHLRAQGCTKRQLEELLKAGLVEDVDFGYVVHDYETYNPLTSTERVRKHRSMKRDETFQERDETLRNENETPLARAPRAGSPVPVPVPVPMSPSPTSSSRPARGGLGLTTEAQAVVAAWHLRTGRLPSSRDIEWLEGQVAELQRLDADELVRCMDDQDAYNVQRGRERTRHLKGYADAWRRLNEHMADAGINTRAAAPLNLSALTAGIGRPM